MFAGLMALPEIDISLSSLYLLQFSRSFKFSPVNRRRWRWRKGVPFTFTGSSLTTSLTAAGTDISYHWFRLQCHRFSSSIPFNPSAALKKPCRLHWSPNRGCCYRYRLMFDENSTSGAVCFPGVLRRDRIMFGRRSDCHSHLWGYRWLFIRARANIF